MYRQDFDKLQVRFTMGLGLIILLLLLLVSSVTAEQPKFDTYDEWLEWAEMEPYQPEVEDWDAIYEAAKEEPPLLIYSSSSRIHPSMERFMEKYPGVTTESINLSVMELNERVRREWDAGLREVGLVLSGGPEVYSDLLVSRNAVTNYVPRDLEKIMDPIETTPMLRHRYHGCIPIYSTDIEDPDTTPWSNIWELTTEKWYDKVAIWDPLDTENTRDYLATLVQHSNEMEEMYEEFFGESIELTTPNAGLEFMKRLLDNGVRIFGDYRDVIQVVNNADGNFAGWITSSGVRMLIDGEVDFKIDTDVIPIYVGWTDMVVGSFTPSPNTAKLAVEWLMSQDGGAEWWGPNFPPFSRGIEVPEGWPTLDDFKIVWNFSEYELTNQVIDYWTLWR